MFLKSSVSLKQEIECSRIIDFIRILYTVPDLADGSTKYCIGRYYNSDTRSIKHKVVSLSRTSTFLSFPTNKLAEEFLTNFHDLIKQVGDLI